MNDLIKNILIIILLIAVGFLGVKYYQHLHEQPEVSILPNTPSLHKNTDGTVSTEIRAATDADISNINTYYQKIIAGLLKKLDAKNINDITQISTQTAGDFKPVFLNDSIYHQLLNDSIYLLQSLNDSLKNNLSDSLKSFSKYYANNTAGTNIYYKDKWLELHGSTIKDSSWSYTVNDVINLVGYEKKTGFLKKEIFVDVVHLNPHTIITGLTAYRVHPKPKTWGVGISAGYITDGRMIKPGILIGISKTFFRW